MRFRTDDMACRSCGRTFPAGELDRHLWCLSCQRAVGRQAAIYGRLTGLVAATGVALYVAATVTPSNRYLLLYAVIVALTYVLTGRIARAVAVGVFRARDRAPGVDREEPSREV